MPALRRYGRHHRALPLVMLHGFLCAGAFFQPNLRVLRQKHFLITADLPGFGDSRDLPPAGSIAAMSEHILAALSAAGHESFHLLGHSMGGMVALQTALAAPERVRSLVLYATGSSGDLPERFETFAESKQRLRQDFSAGKQRICATWLSAGAAHPHFDLLRQCADLVSPAAAESALDAMAAFDVRDKISALRMPALIISAEHDKTYSLQNQRQLKTGLPHAQWTLIPNAAHCAHLENEDLFNQTISEWLENRH